MASLPTLFGDVLLDVRARLELVARVLAQADRMAPSRERFAWEAWALEERRVLEEVRRFTRPSL